MGLRARFLWLAAAGLAVLAVVVLWTVPRLGQSTGTLVVVAAGRGPSSLAESTLLLRESNGTWLTVGKVSGAVPAAPDQRQLLTLSVPAVGYDALRLGGEAQPVNLTITAGQVEPLLLGISSGRVLSGWVYAGNDDVNLGLGEIAGRFTPLPNFANLYLVDQSGQPFTPSTIAGKDVLIAAFHTNCHETCPLYTALFLQLAKRVPRNVVLVEVTTDPAADNARTLAAYSRQVGATWTFVTGGTGQITQFWKPFGVELASGDAHVSTLVVVDRHGYVRLIYRGVPNVGHDIPSSLTTSMSARGLHELASGGDGWGMPDVLGALATITGAEASQQTGGGKAPGFTLQSTDGRAVAMSDLAGEPLVINFWATYCPPCRTEMPLLQKDVSESGSRLVLINEGETRDAASAYLRALGISQAALLDQDMSVGRAYGLSALPMTVFVRSDGTIVRRQIGQLDDRVLAAELSNLVTQ